MTPTITAVLVARLSGGTPAAATNAKALDYSSIGCLNLIDLPEGPDPRADTTSARETGPPSPTRRSPLTVPPTESGDADPGQVTRIAEEFIRLREAGDVTDLDEFCGREA